ncbi:phage protein [Desulfocucumis palustris]|uniref:Phage protein n=1 Tax=Desulfocucumis palustris TaxID=1898651 RepID=A0A2L2X7N5_9FIRM|nr:hypothetical protein [Desulfocucumis palustris]GBF32207.1 phage protein [Desulfocucumis palustris]
MIFANCDGLSPVEQDFIWVGEYIDGTHLSEFDFVTKEENSFYRLQQDKLLRFGLIGHHRKFFYETDGTFNLSGSCIEAIYRASGEDYFLTGGLFNTVSRDVIMYKDAEAMGLANFTQAGGGVGSRITQYNFGYKAVLNIDGVTFNFKAIVKIPFNKPIYIALRLVADKELDGKFVIRRNGLVAEEFIAPLKPNVGGELNWVLR